MKNQHNKITLTFPSDPCYLKMIRAVLETYGQLAGFNHQQIEDIILATNEACANIINHAYEDNPHHLIYMDVSANKTHMQIELRDQGKEVSKEMIKPRPLEEVRPGGLGVHIMRELMDEVRYERNEPKGNRLILIKKR